MGDFEQFYNQIVKNKYNYGTGAWSVINSNIKTVMNEYGEYVPCINDIGNFQITEAELEKIKKVTLLSDMSLNETDVANRLFSDIEGIKFDKRVGYYLNSYAGYVTEADYRKNGSSGGFVTWIFKELLEKKLIDGVIHVKPNNDSEKPVLFNYGISRSIEEICEGAKTKYYPVEFSEALNHVKENPGKYAFIGGPSFVMSLRLLQSQDQILNDRVVFLLGIITAHQKTSKYTEAIAWQCGIKPGNLLSINYRVKSKDISPNNYVAELTGIVDGKKTTIVKNMRDIIGTSWGQGFFKIKASDFSDDVMNETADIALGDAWLPQYIKDTGGTSILITRNPVIDAIISEGKRSNKIHLEEISLDDIYKSQEANFRHTIDELSYRLYKKDKHNQWRPQKRVEANNNISFLRARVQDSREEISIKSHEIYKKAVEKDDLDYYIYHMRKLTKKHYKINRLIQIRKLGISEVIRIVKRKFRVAQKK